MAFNFLGTLSLEQLNSFEAFLSGEIINIDEQINTMRTEVNNLMLTRNELLTADANNGGTTNQWVNDNLLQDVIRVAKSNDANSAYLMEQVKKPFIQNIKYQRERLEFKIKKITDAIEQTNEMIDRKSIAKTNTSTLISEIRALFTAQNSDHLFQTTREMKDYFTAIPREAPIVSPETGSFGSA